MYTGVHRVLPSNVMSRSIQQPRVNGVWSQLYGVLSSFFRSLFFSLATAATFQKSRPPIIMMSVPLAKMPYTGTPYTSILVHWGLLPLSYTLPALTPSVGSSSDKYENSWSNSSHPFSVGLLFFADTCLVALWVYLKPQGPPVTVAHNLHFMREVTWLVTQIALLTSKFWDWGYQPCCQKTQNFAWGYVDFVLNRPFCLLGRSSRGLELLLPLSKFS